MQNNYPTQGYISIQCIMLLEYYKHITYHVCMARMHMCLWVVL